MTAQSSFFVNAPVIKGREDALRHHLQRLNSAPGFADPANPLVPFGQFGRLHVARLVVIDDLTLEDRDCYPSAAYDAPVSLAFMGFCDGPADAMLADLAARAPGLQGIFAHCEGFVEGADLLAWMRAHSIRSATDYVNWRGRTVNQAREEARLRDELFAAMKAALASDGRQDAPLNLAAKVRLAVNRPLTRLDGPSFGERLCEACHFLTLPIALILLLPLLVVALVPFVVVLRGKERRDPVIVPRPSADRIAALSKFENHDVTNAFTAVGSLKPGWFRHTLTRGVFWALAWAVRHLYGRGRLARVGTIHFARWAWIDGGRRLLFASNYDGGLESYMDDFINKAGFGLNLVFSNGIGYPRTDWLISGGARREQDFKAFLRRHQIPTDVWYKAAAGLTTYDLARNSRIRRGYERGHLTDRDAAAWLIEIAA